MAGEFAVHPMMLREIAQSLLEFKKMGRSIESGAEALIPLAVGDATTDMLEQVVRHGRDAADCASRLYRSIAREAAQADGPR